MAQGSSLRQQNVSGSRSKGSKVNSDVHLTLLQNDLKNADNSVGLIDPFILESFFEENRTALYTQKKSFKNANTNKTSVQKLGTTVNRATYSKNTEGETALSPTKSRVFPPGQWYPSEEFLLKQQNKKTAITSQNRSIKKDDTSHFEGRGATQNRAKVTTSVLNDEQNKVTDYPVLNKKPSISTKTPDKVNSKAVSDELKPIRRILTDKTETAKTKNQNTSGAVAKKVSDAERDERSTRQLRSSYKNAEPVHKPRSVADFSIEVMDWYYEDPNYYKKMCEEILSDFAIPKERSLAINAKLSYTYLLLDSRKCGNKINISWLDFIKAIFYIGKGTNDRDFQHAKDTEKWLTAIDNGEACDKRNKKYLKIKDIWDSGNPMKVFIITEEIIREEALTREAAMIDAMGLRRLCNIINGSYYGVAVTLRARERLELGATLLMEARDMFKWKEVFDVYPKRTIHVDSLERTNFISEFDEDDFYCAN